MAAQRSRRVTLPGAADLFFRSTTTPEPAVRDEGGAAERRGAERPEPPTPPAEGRFAPAEEGSEAASAARSAERAAPVPRARKPRARTQRAPQPSGRQRHEEKITVYISAAELLALEQTRLTLRAEHGLTVDRGRIVREAVAVLLADFEEHGESSMLVQRLGDD
ncbi:hypothetical protein [Marinitenerispora sediminis]|uniref:hypothetical protein n=1 Tax=Marinitenerispora sediminis TaxID=1931232 RepID=UPI0018F22890|nr:hypothetical protein [Marinitenerispora sediminis]